MNKPINRTRRCLIIGAGGVALAPLSTLVSCKSFNHSPGHIDPSTITPTAAWAEGGTDLITVPFPGDDLFATGNTCNLLDKIPSLTEGPCYFRDISGEDIADGEEGLPMQLCLRIVDENCQPLENRMVEVWHCNARGVYSADTSESSDAGRFRTGFCTNGDHAALKSTWGRGQLRTDNNGRVNFRTIFPGWYPSRTIHFHFSVATADDSRRFVSQLCFTDLLAAEVCSFHGNYKDRGQQDTPLADDTDGIFPKDGSREFLLSTRANSDNTLLAWHTVKVRA